MNASFLGQLLEKKSEAIMLFSGICILLSVLTVALTGDFIFWKVAKLFYALGVILIIFDK